MKRSKWLAAVVAAGVVGCGGDPGGNGARDGASDVDAVVAEAPVYVDVRSPAEFASGHVEGAINIPHTEMAQRWRELEAYRDEPMVVYCRTGRRSGIALDVLREHGFEDAVNGGGLSDLARRGVPTTR